MFAPLVAKPQTKASASSTSNRAHQRAALVEPHFGQGAVKEAHMLAGSIGNQAMIRLLAQQAASPIGKEPGDQHEQPADPAADQMHAPDHKAAPSMSGDVSTIPGFPRDRSNPHPTRPPLVVSPLRGAIQPKLVVGQINDPLEHEADRVADQVLAAPAHPAIGGSPRQIQRVSGRPTGQPMVLPASVDQALASPGRPLEPPLRQDMEQRFDHDFSRVRVHADAAAEQSTRDVNANAYTVGHDIVFGAGRFAPGTHDGRRLIAHELTHAVQQSGADGMNVCQSNDKRGLSPIAPQQSESVTGLLQRQPKSGESGKVYRCTLDLVGSKLTLDCDGRHFSGKATHDLSPGTYDMQYDGNQFRIGVEVDPSSPKVLSVQWNVKRKKEVDDLRRYLDSLKGQPLRLNVRETESAGSVATPDIETQIQGGASKSSGTGTGTASGAGAGAKEKATGEKAGQQGTGTGTGSGSATTQQGAGTVQQGQQETGSGSGTGTKSGTPGATQQGEGSPGGTTASDYPAKLQSVLDAAQPQKLTEDQSRRLKAILDQLSPSDIELFKQFSVKNPGGDPEHLIQSLKLFQSAKSEYEKQNPPQTPADLPDDAQKALASAIEQYRDDMTPDQKEALARSTIATVSNKQLKSMTAKQIAEGLIRVDQQVASIADDMSKGIQQTLDADSGWGKAAGAARTTKGAAAWWAFLSVAALIAAQFIPGLNVLVDVLAANALAAGMVMFTAANAEQEWDTQAAAHAKSQQEFEKYVVGGIEARNAKIMAGAGLALSALGGILKATPLGRGLESVSKKLSMAKGLLSQRAAGSLGAAKTMALETLEKFRTDLQPYAAQARQAVSAAVKRLKNVKGADFLREAKGIPELQQLFEGDQLKAMESLSPAALDTAKNELLADLPTSANEMFKSLDRQADALKTKIQNASTPDELAAVLDEGLKKMDPQMPLVLEAAGTETKQNVVQARVAQDDPAAGQKPVTPQTQAPATPPATQTQAPTTTQTQPPAQAPATQADAPAAPATQQTQPPAKAPMQAPPKVEKPGHQVIDQPRREKATARKEGLEKEMKDRPADVTKREDEIVELKKQLEKLKSQRKKIPEGLKNDKDFRKLNELGDDEAAIEARLEALQELEQKLTKENKLTPEMAEYIDWVKKTLTLRKEIQGSGEANVVDTIRVQEIERKGGTMEQAEAELREASQTVKKLVEQRGPNFNAKKNISHDEVIGKGRWEKLQASDKKVTRVQKDKITGELKTLDPLDTDHLVSLDMIANRPELTEFLRIFSKASQAIKGQMLEDLAELGDIPTNLRRMRWDANIRKNNRSWDDITYAEAKEFGYDVLDVDAMRTAENGQMKIILDKIAELTDKYRDLTSAK